MKKVTITILFIVFFLYSCKVKDNKDVKNNDNPKLELKKSIDFKITNLKKDIKESKYINEKFISNPEKYLYGEFTLIEDDNKQKVKKANRL